MTTSRNTAANDLLPLSDPKAIIRARNAASLRDRPFPPFPSHATALLVPALMSDTGDNHHDREEPYNVKQKTDSAALDTAKDWFRRVLKAQHASIVQAREDRQQVIEDRRADCKLFLAAHQDNADRIGRLEDLLLAMNLKNESGAQPARAEPGRVDLQKFRTSDGPMYRGPFQETKSFLRWIHGVQIFFETKDVSNAADKIKILGNLIAETNLQLFYANNAAGFLNRLWEEFKARLFDSALPSNWRSGLQRQVCKLDMSPAETFLEYSTRARTLQSLFNFDATNNSRLGNLQLAQFLVYGLPESLQDWINKHQLLKTVPFAYRPFEKQAKSSFLALQRPAETPPASRPVSNAPPSLPRDKFIWRVHSYLDSQGLCHFCKKHCGSVAGACPGPLNRAHIDIPSSFQAPPKPSDYNAPRAWSRTTAAPGKPTQAPAGRPATCAASVAGIADVTPQLEAQVAALTVDAVIREDARWDSYFDDEGCFPDLDPAAVAALEELDEQLLANEIARAEQADLADDIAGI
ncbi:hypothetical protein PCASD_24919 [Puccinia coronata f. sp. avenae]|uniref:Retrotransposon gag domain-containing protein n=1 Tax=Puccinia coronata f. sp. avenae TaxID=200324 RepID=A0A2N5SH30_9BASI|nr:hypothetical protein PCASD_24919 [Puccinia coronata f. sp. avenae]